MTTTFNCKMLLSTYLTVLLASLPILVISIPQVVVEVQSQVCTAGSSCDPGFFCGSEACLSCESAGCGVGSICGFIQAGKLECRCPTNTLGDPSLRCDPLRACSSILPCGPGSYCGSGICLSCESVGCGVGSVCGLNDFKRLVCLCPANTWGNPYVECLPDTGCTNNMQCGKQGYCDRGKCVFDPCLAVNCGQHSRCKLLGGQQAQCQPIETNVIVDRQGNPSASFQGVNIAGNHRNDLNGSAQSSNQGVGAQGGNQEGVTQAVNQGAGSQAGSHAGASHVVNQGGSVQGNNNGVGTQVGSSTHTDNGGQLGSSNQIESSTQTNTQGGGSQGSNQINVPGGGGQGCRINSHCKENERCQSRTGSCVDPCKSVNCGERAICQVAQRQGQCVCPVNMQGDPLIRCNPKPEEDTVFFPEEDTDHEQRTRHPGCLTVPDPGECRGAFKRFYYNNQTDQCDCFLFGGCDEDKIRFTWVTFEECQSTCLPGNTAEGQGCKRATLEEVQTFLEEERKNRENSGN